jgi:hypothetical protein
MRKDLFIVGVRLLGLWQLLGAVSSLAYMICFWYGYIQSQALGQEYNSIHFVVQLLTGIFLLFGTHYLFHLVDRIKPEEAPAEEESETEVGPS